MKLLLFSDLHTDTGAARDLVARSRSADVVVGAGDFGNLRRNVGLVLEVLRAIPCPAVLVAGNNESTDELAHACRHWPAAHVLHGSGVDVLGVTFYGLPGGVPVTPFGSWSYDFTEEQAAEMLAGCPVGAVLVSHSPPKGVVDISSGGTSLGSETVRDAVLRLRPRLVVCGHIHGSAGQVGYLGDTPVVNAGPGGVEWELAGV